MARLSSLWPAVYALRTAESLADLALVAGPQDEPPADAAALPGWAREWSGRANDALAKAKQMAASAAEVVRERARAIGELLQRGAEDIARRIRKEYARRWDQDKQAALDAVELVSRGAGEVVGTVASGLVSTPSGLVLAILLALYLLR